MDRHREDDEQAALECRFYMSISGAEPVRDWIKRLSAEVRQEIGIDIGRVQWRWPIGLPLVDGLGRGLHEVRTAFDGNIYRVFFCVEDGVMWLLHGIMKKSRRAPQGDLEIARKRQKEVEKNK